MRIFKRLALLQIALASLLIAQDVPSAVDKFCEASTAQPLTAPSFSGPLAESELERCDERALYYGFEDKPNYAAALQCGWYQRAHPRSDIGNMFYGPGVLTMLYANGRGVPRNYDLAIRFACENDWTAEAELEHRVGHLEELQNLDPHGTDFDLCDDITSGLNQGACAAIQAHFADADRAVKLAALAQSLPTAAEPLLPGLQKAEAAFEKSRVENEIDLNGTGRAAEQFQEETVLRDQFLMNLQRFRSGDIPTISDSDLVQLDRQLNAVYKQIRQALAKESGLGTVEPEGVRATQRQWLRLAEAWASFARAAYPNLSATSIRAHLIRLRLDQLRSLVP
jgi:hypothetical protein